MGYAEHMEDSEILAAHLQYLHDSKYAASTIRERMRILATLPHVIDVDRLAVQAWQHDRQTKPDGEPRAATSLSGEASHARDFWRWCRTQGLIDHNPADWLHKVRTTKTKAVAVTEGELYQLMHAAPEDVRRMIALTGLAGLRSSEAAAITWEDIDYGNETLWVRSGKGGKDRPVPLSGGLLASLGDPGAGPIVGRQVTAKAFSAALGRYMRKRGVNLTAHKLRARYITRFIAATGDAVAAAEVAGHSGLGSIMRYAVASSDTMRRGAEAAGRIG